MERSNDDHRSNVDTATDICRHGRVATGDCPRCCAHKWPRNVGREDNDDHGNSIDATADNFPRSSRYKWRSDVGPEEIDICRHGRTATGERPRCSRYKSLCEVGHERGTTDDNYPRSSGNKWCPEREALDMERSDSDDDDEVVISPKSRRRAADLGYGTSASPAASPERHMATASEASTKRRQDSQPTSMVIEDQRRPSSASSESTVGRGSDPTRATRRGDRVTFDPLPRPRRRTGSRIATRPESPSSDIEITSSGSTSAVSTPSQPRLKSVVVPVSQHQRSEPLRRGTSSVSASMKSRDEGSPERDGAETDREPDPVCRRQPPDDDGGGGGSSGSDDDKKKDHGERKREKREDSDEGRKRSVDRGRKQKRRHSASRSTSRRRDSSKKATKSSGRHHRDSSSSTDRHVSRRKHRQRIKVDKYDGSTCVEVFLTEFKYIADYNDWDDEDRLAHLKAALTGSAKYLVTESEGLTYEDMKEKLRRRYSTREQQERFKVELRSRRRRADESLQALSHDIERLIALAYPGAPPAMRDILGKDAFIDALNNTSLEYKIKEREVPTMAQALTTAMRLEALYKSKRAADELTKPRHIRQVQHGACSDGAADRPLGLGNDEPTPVQLSDSTGSRVDQPTKPAKKNGGAKGGKHVAAQVRQDTDCLLYTSPSPRDS